MKVNLNHQLNDPDCKGVEILSIGTELLLGNIVNTNSQWIAEELSKLGLNHYRQSTIGDNSNRISNLIPMRRMANSNEYKGSIIYMLSEASSYMTGSIISVDGGRTVW